MRNAILAAFTTFGLGGSALACDVALLLAVDVSGSVQPHEYRIQMDGLATALRDGSVSAALVEGKAMVSLMQWTGSSRQDMTIPWQQMNTSEDVAALAEQIEDAPRRWRNFSTAIGEALDRGLIAMLEVPECTRKVIDVSGDGISNEGVAPTALHRDLESAGITVNALAIDTGSEAEDLTDYFRNHVIVGDDAFVLTASGFEEYPDRIRRKLLREVAKKIAALDPD